MPNQSEAIKAEFNNSLPDTISGFLSKTIPTPPEIAIPTDVDEAIIAQGVLSKYIRDVFAEMAGFSIAAAMMHIGELNSVNQVMALASLQINPDAYMLEIILPSTTVTYAIDAEFMCEVAISGDLTNVSAVSVSRTNPDSSGFTGSMLSASEAVELEVLPQELVKEGHFYAPQTVSEPGTYQYSFAASIGGEELQSETISITVA